MVTLRRRRGIEVVVVTRRGPWPMVALLVMGSLLVPCGALSQNDTSRTLLMAEALFRIARAEMTKRNFSEAETHLRRLVGLSFPQGDEKAQTMLAASYVGLVDCLVRQTKHDEGLRASQQALRLPAFSRPSVFRAELYKLMGKIHEAKGDSSLSVEYFRKAVNMLDSLERRDR